jgi:nicotinamide phosphoribosyltransferase
MFFKKHGLELNLDGWAYIARELKGKLPLRINAVPEGSVLKNGTVLMTVVNTDQVELFR